MTPEEQQAIIEAKKAYETVQNTRKYLDNLNKAAEVSNGGHLLVIAVGVVATVVVGKMIYDWRTKPKETIEADDVAYDGTVTLRQPALERA